MASSQYYSSPAPSPYQPYAYNYYLPAPTSPVLPPMYAPTFTPPAIPAYSTAPMFTQSPMFAPLPLPTTPTCSSISGSIPSAPGSVSNYAPIPTVASPQTTAYPLPITPNPYTTAPLISTYASVPAIRPNYKSTAVSSKPQPATSTCTPPTSAIAYYLTTPLETPKIAMAEKVKEIVTEKLPPPTYPCPFCTGFENVPKNSKVLPPPPCSSVLPGILDRIPTIKIPEVLKIKDLSKLAKPSPLLADLFEHKLSGKLRFDEDLLDGFLIGLGLGKCTDL